MSTIRPGDTITVTEGSADPYEAEVLAIDHDATGQALLRVRALLPYDATVRVRPGIRITPRT